MKSYILFKFPPISTTTESVERFVIGVVLCRSPNHLTLNQIDQLSIHGIVATEFNVMHTSMKNEIAKFTKELIQRNALGSHDMLVFPWKSNK